MGLARSERFRRKLMGVKSRMKRMGTEKTVKQLNRAIGKESRRQRRNFFFKDNEWVAYGIAGAGAYINFEIGRMIGKEVGRVSNEASSRRRRRIR